MKSKWAEAGSDDHMTISEPVGLAGTDQRARAVDMKLRGPIWRDGLIPRTELVDRLLASRPASTVAIVAPAGYGKTTVLAEWLAREERDVVWVSIDGCDNDPAALLSVVMLAMSRVQPVDPAVVESVCAGRRSIPNSLTTLTSTFVPGRPVVLALDNVDAIDNPASLDVIVELALRMPNGSQLAYASRKRLPLPNSLLRSRGALVELGVDELAMDRFEAEQVLAVAGADLTPDEMGVVFTASEGWPAGLYLAGLASQGRRHPSATSFVFRGDDVLMADYLRTEVLADLPSATRSFLTRTSVLERLSGPLCDAVLRTTGSQLALEAIESSNLLLVPLDRDRAWFRYHRLLRDLLAVDLARREPDLVPELHNRAAAWFAALAMYDEAIEHAQLAGNPDLVAQLVATTLQPAYSAGRSTRVRAWLGWFEAEGLIDQYPDVAALGAMAEALLGNPAGTERWTAAAEAAPADSDQNGNLAFLRALIARRGTAAIRDDARLAQEWMGQTNMLAAPILLEGISHLLDGHPDLAEPILAHALDVALYRQAMPTAAVAAAELALISIGRDEWDEAQAQAARAQRIVETGHLQDYLEASIVYAVAARVAIHRHDLTEARGQLSLAARVRPLLTYAIPCSAQFQLVIATAYLQLADATGARTVLREVRTTLRQRPDLGVIAAEADDLAAKLDLLRHDSVGASSLTAAELRLLPHLYTHLSFREIGERLHVSRHTVKSQAISVYRKLGVSSRSDAIARIEEIGLIGR